MKISVVMVGKTGELYLKEGIGIYLKRLQRYVPVEWVEIPDLKASMDELSQKRREGELILEKVKNCDRVILLDEHGEMPGSLKFSKDLQHWMNSGTRNVAMVIGGPYGFSDELYKRYSHRLSLSAMTFSHQMIRLFLVEQIYRGFSILRNEPYHHE